MIMTYPTQTPAHYKCYHMYFIYISARNGKIILPADSGERKKILARLQLVT